MDFQNKIAEIISNICEIEVDEIVNIIEIPADNSNGDFAFPCFKLAKIMHKSPNIIAKEIADKIIKPDFIEKVNVVNAYINFYIEKAVYVKSVISEIINKVKVMALAV